MIEIMYVRDILKKEQNMECIIWSLTTFTECFFPNVFVLLTEPKFQINQDVMGNNQ